MLTGPLRTVEIRGANRKKRSKDGIIVHCSEKDGKVETEFDSSRCCWDAKKSPFE